MHNIQRMHACYTNALYTGCPTSTVVGLSLGIVAAYILGLGTASTIGIISHYVRKKSG